MNKKLLVFIVIIVVIILGWFIFNKSNNSSLINPNVVSPISSSSPIPTPVSTEPKSYKYDRNTDLKKELDSINPQVLESDF